MSVFDLINAVGSILKRIQERDKTRDVYEDKWTVSDKIDHLLNLVKSRPRLRFSELFEGNSSRLEVVTTFLALLELIRKVPTAAQPEPFSEIEIKTVGARALRPTSGGIPRQRGKGLSRLWKGRS
ncbi:MAG: segregation/condensation protein A [Verrucomicrobiota bacterium]